MTRAIAILAACAAVAWLLRRRGDGASRPEQPDPMDGVQWDPWTREVREGAEPVLHPSLHRWLVPDPTYLEATALAAIRRSAQSADVTTEGMS